MNTKENSDTKEGEASKTKIAALNFFYNPKLTFNMTFFVTSLSILMTFI